MANTLDSVRSNNRGAERGLIGAGVVIVVLVVAYIAYKVLGVFSEASDTAKKVAKNAGDALENATSGLPALGQSVGNIETGVAAGTDDGLSSFFAAFGSGSGSSGPAVPQGPILKTLQPLTMVFEGSPSWSKDWRGWVTFKVQLKVTGPDGRPKDYATVVMSKEADGWTEKRVTDSQGRVGFEGGDWQGEINRSFIAYLPGEFNPSRTSRFHPYSGDWATSVV